MGFVYAEQCCCAFGQATAMLASQIVGPLVVDVVYAEQFAAGVADAAGAAGAAGVAVAGAAGVVVVAPPGPYYSSEMPEPHDYSLSSFHSGYYHS
jgi:hypothetical protein